MADNLGYTEGSGRTIAADEIGGVHYQRLKVALGVDGSHEKDLSLTDLQPAYTPISLSKNVTTAGTRVQLSAASVPCKKIDITPKRANTGYIYVGGVAVDSNNGIWLGVGDVYCIEVSDLNKVWIDSSVSGEGVMFNYYT